MLILGFLLDKLLTGPRCSAYLLLKSYYDHQDLPEDPSDSTLPMMEL